MSDISSVYEFTADDEHMVTLLLAEIRGERMTAIAAAKDATNPDTKAFFEGLADALLKRSRSLHRALHRLEIRGLGPMV